MARRLALILGWSAAMAAVGQAPAAPGRATEILGGRRPELWAIVVGVDSHTDPRIPDSKTAVDGAFRVYDWFRKQAGWDRGHLLLLVDLGADNPGTVDSPAFPIRPTRKNLAWSFDVWLKDKARPGDLIVVYYAGRAHGGMVPAGSGAEPGVQYSLLPRDALLADVPQTGFSLTRAVDAYARQGQYQVVCWLGTGLDGGPPSPKPPGATSPTAAAPANIPAALKPKPPGSIGTGREGAMPSGRDWTRRLARWPGVTAWLAADRPQQLSPVVDPWVSFTSALLDGLGGIDAKNNLAACLRAMNQDPKLRLQGFHAVGGVPPAVSLWRDEFEESLRPSRPEMVLQAGHAGLITGIVSSADSRHLFTASQDSTLRVWSVPDRALLRVLTGHEVGVNALALSRDGRWLISGGGRSGIQVHGVAADYEPKLINSQPHRQRVEQVVPLPDGRHFISVDQQAKCFLWDLAEGAMTPRPWLDEVDCLEVAVGGGGGRKEPGTVAVRCGDNSVRIFGRDGLAKVLRSFQHREAATALAVSPDGRLVVTGHGGGRVTVYTPAKSASIEVAGTGSPVRRLAISRTGRLAVVGDRGVDLYTLVDGKPAADKPEPLAPWPAAGLSFSADGRYLAASDQSTGALRAWRVDGDGPVRDVLNEDGALALATSFAGDGRTLLVGGKDGSVKTFPLEPREGETSWDRKADRGKVQQLGASPGRRFLLILNDRDEIQTWDLKDRACRKLPGRWSSGAFVDEDRLALTVAADAPESAGRLVLMNRETAEVSPAFFARSGEGFEIGDEVAFGNATVSPDGSRVAASAIADQAPLVCVWDASTGRLTHWASRIEDPVQSLSFSTDARFLLSAGDSPRAGLWDLSASRGAIERPAMTFQDKVSDQPVTRAVIRPGAARQVVTGHRDGRVRVWGWKDGGPAAEIKTFVAAGGRAIKALAFSPDGKYLAVAGDSVNLWVGEIEPAPSRLQAFDGLRPHHSEQINALLSWPAPLHLFTLKLPTLDGSAGLSFMSRPAPLLVSGSDDTTVKFWDLDSRALRVTFSAAAGNPRLAASGSAPAEVDWVAYTPQGQFDAHGKGRELVRFRRKDQLRSLDQFDDSLYAYQLAEHLRRGTSPGSPPSLAEPPPLAIDPPNRASEAGPDTELAISIGGEGDRNDFRDLRIYHNDVPVSTGLEDGPAKLPDVVRVPVKLVRGSNRFYAMASRADAFDSRTPDVDIRYNGPPDPGRVHILALGVGDYSRRRLSYPERDARRLSDVLQRRGIDADKRMGMKILLTNADVSEKSVARAFRDLAKQVRGRPQDTVVVFIAGHTGVFSDQKFCLLLNSYPFAADAPIMVASRDASDLIPSDQLKPEYILPYATVATNMMRLDALNRLVIVDACQAEAIYSDPEVADIQKWMEIGSRKARTSYLMAARKGEPALEIDPLKHGVFTYALLRGMRAISEKEPKEIARLKLPEDADFNRDGTLTTGELDAYVKQTLPLIAAQFPRIVANRRAAENSAAGPAIVPADRLDQESRLRTAETTSFPLVPIREATAANP